MSRDEVERRTVDNRLDDPMPWLLNPLHPLNVLHTPMHMDPVMQYSPTPAPDPVPSIPAYEPCTPTYDPPLGATFDVASYDTPPSSSSDY